MNNFPEYNCENYGGLSGFNFIPQYAVASMPSCIGNLLSEVLPVKTGFEWFIGLSLYNSLQFTETPKPSDPGDLYEYIVSGIYPGQTTELATLLDEMKGQPFILDIIDNNNQRRLLGSLINPVMFKYAYASKDQVGSRPEYTFSFTWTSQNPAPFYNPQ
jgi:hypothetical protein